MIYDEADVFLEAQTDLQVPDVWHQFLYLHDASLDRLEIMIVQEVESPDRSKHQILLMFGHGVSRQKVPLVFHEVSKFVVAQVNLGNV